jgi:hypothetical protein
VNVPQFYQDALDRIQKLNFDDDRRASRLHLFRTDLEHELRQLDIEGNSSRGERVPFASVVEMEETRRMAPSIPRRPRPR